MSIKFSEFIPDPASWTVAIRTIRIRKNSQECWIHFKYIENDTWRMCRKVN